MIRIPKSMASILSLSRHSTIQSKQSLAYFSEDRWKERDEAYQRIYISKQESKYPINLEQIMKKMLDKFGNDIEAKMSSDDQFERRLNQILNRYKIENKSFVAEILNLHKDL